MPNNMDKRKILHIDIDAFFSSVEQMDNPKFRGKPVIVGGVGKRGVVSTASYEARVYGVHSAMPTFRAKALCPHGIFVRGRMNRYKEVSNQVFSFLHQITDEMQQVSIDEAYLDVTGLYHSTEYIANYIKDYIKENIGLTISVGGSYNLFLAKLASEWNKPNGTFFIGESDVPDILKPLKIDKIHGLGKKSVKRLNDIGIFYVDDLLKYRKEDLQEFLGSAGESVYDKIRGIDYRPVISEAKNKSIARETTLYEDTKDINIIKKWVVKFCEELAKSLEKSGYEARTISIKYKTDDFRVHTKSRTLYMPIYGYEDIKNEALRVLDEIEFCSPIRLIGVTLAGLTPLESHQFTLFD